MSDSVPPGAAASNAADVPGVGPAVGADSVWRFFFGDGTASNPDAGILWGNGYSYDAASCTGLTACNGGAGGILGNGGAGYNGGNGGSAG